MITSINEFKSYKQNEEYNAGKAEFDKWIQANAEKISKRNPIILPNLNALLKDSGFTGERVEGKDHITIGFSIVDSQGRLMMTNKKLYLLVDELKRKAQQYIAAKTSTVPNRMPANKPAPIAVPMPSAPVTNYSINDLEEKLSKSGYMSRDLDIDFSVEKRGDKTFVSVVAFGKRGIPRDAYMAALRASKPSLLPGFKYTTGKAVDYRGNEVTPETIRADDERYDDRGYTDSEFSGEVRYEITNENKANESVRHGMFPYFSLNKKTGEITYSTCDNDLAVDAISYENDPNSDYFSYCREDWSESGCKHASEEVKKMFASGVSFDEVMEYLEEY